MPDVTLKSTRPETPSPWPRLLVLALPVLALHLLLLHGGMPDFIAPALTPPRPGGIVSTAANAN